MEEIHFLDILVPAILANRLEKFDSRKGMAAIAAR